LTGLSQQVRRTLKKHGLCPEGARVLVGISGGSDSVALTLLLLDLSRHAGFSVVALAHLNHQLRPNAALDETFCREFAARLGIPLVVDATDVRAFSEARGLSLEVAARRVRYTFLERAAASVGADQIAVGHTEDDQAETFLLKLMRGAGTTGLGAVYPRRGLIVRPLLDVSRAELRAYLAARGERWVEDETNDDLANPRNRLRHIVLPELDRTAGGATRPAIARAAGLIRDDAGMLDDLGRARFDALVAQTAVGLEIDAPGLLVTPLPIRRRVLLQALRHLAGDREVGLDHVETALTILGGSRGGASLPGSHVELLGGKLVLLMQKGT
jgi:tRNA(Ile)-lysidine synthase